ncbi:MAG: matrixin family metalloprotease [Candidatus Melainabacteria bacterium]|nr:matrixin family metalloprotease [Candidatus Melainabacteria bacterium]
MTFDHDKFMKGVGLYEEANRRRNNLEFDFAFNLYERAQEFLDGRLDVTVFYDMALAANLNSDLDGANNFCNKGRASLELIKEENPGDSRIANLQPLIDSLAKQLEFQKMIDNSATNYANQITCRVWGEDNYPLTIWIADKANHADGFDNAISDLIYDAFKKWAGRCPWFSIARANKSDQSISKIVIKQASPGDLQDGSGGQTKFLPESAFPDKHIDKVNVRVYIPSADINSLSLDQKKTFQSLILHEAGHALGIDGHSPFATDLMWWKSPLLDISSRDVETMKIIYGQ